jgi:pyridoxal phosphate enzyme (YggS family)
MAVSAHPGAGELAARMERVNARIRQACLRSGRAPESVRLVAVGKRHPPELIRAAYALGQREFGENYLQELSAKADALGDLPHIRWRFIGHLQRNKARDAARICHSVDTLDSLRTAEALDRRAQQAGRSLEVLIEVNLASEDQKAGCRPAEVQELARAVRRLDALQLRGLLAIPPLEAEPEQNRPRFRALRQLAHDLSLPELSMGMSADLEVAIEEGATMVRVGTDIFGERDGG